MLWRTSPPAPLLPRTAPLPDAEALRKALLQASAQRGRSVARRRLIWRWLVWIGGRFVMPAMLAFGIGAWLWLAVLPHAGGSLGQLLRGLGMPESKSPVQASTAPSSSPIAPEREPADPAAVEAPALFTPEGEPIIVPLNLRLDTTWAAPRSTAEAPIDSSGDAIDIQPRLIPENWLHSKEP